MLVPKEVIRPGTFWYKDEATGAPRKLVVTPELTKHWHDQGNAMLSAGLTVPVPMEHDFDSHPMTPANKLKSNAGWVKSYEMRGDRLFSVIDIQDAEVAKKLPGTIRWSSPWINSFTDGNGKAWNNVISHLALTTRPRIVEQQPFGSAAAALSVATDIKVRDAATERGYCLTNAGLLAQDGQPTYPIAFSLLTDGVSLAQSRDTVGRFSKGGSGHTAVGEAMAAHEEHGSWNTETKEHGSAAIAASKKAMSSKKDKAAHHAAAAEAHYKAYGTHYSHAVKQSGGWAAGLHKVSDAHKKAAAEHKAHAESLGAKVSFSIDAAFAFPPTKDKSKVPAPGGKAPPPKSDATPDTEVEEESSEEIPDDGDESNNNNIDLEPFNDPAGDVSMTELLCDLLGALGVVCEQSDDENMFKRNLYNAAMTEIHKRVGESKAKENGMDPKNRTNPPGQPPNNKPPGQPGQNPIIQQEQQPMYMGLSMNLDEIKKLDEPLRSVALSMYEATQKANARAAESEKLVNSLRDKQLKEVAAIRSKRATLLARFMPGAKADIDAMMIQPAMALSMGDGGVIVDPMHQTLSVLEKAMGNLPRLLTTEFSALSAEAQPTDADMLSEARMNELADMQARNMGCPPTKKVG